MADQGQQNKTCCATVASHIGLIYAFGSCLFYSGSLSVAKLVTSVNPLCIALIRMIILNVCITSTMMVKGVPFIVEKSSQYNWLISRGVAGGLGDTCIFTAVHMMPVGDAAVVIFSTPVFTAILTWLCLKESINFVDFFFAFLSVAGVIVVAKPSFLFPQTADTKVSSQSTSDANNPLFGVIFAFAGAFFISLVMISSRKLGKDVHYMTVLFYFSTVGMVTATLLLYVGLMST